MKQTTTRTTLILSAWIGTLLVWCLSLDALEVQPAANFVNPASPFKAWAPWTVTRFNCDYPTLMRRDGMIQIWFEANSPVRQVICKVGPDLDHLSDTDGVRFSNEIIQGYNRPLNGVPFPILTRSSCSILKDGTHIVLTAIGPKYGSEPELYPALFVSPNGKPGTWKHIGPPVGEPTMWLTKARERNGQFRIEGGSIFEMPDGKLRMYIHGFMDPKDWPSPRPAGKVPGKIKDTPKPGNNMAPVSLICNSFSIAEAPSVEGPWVFLKDANGRLIDVTKGLTNDCNWLWPNVMKIGDSGYMVTGSNKWPPTAVFAAFSVNGITFDIPKVGKTAQPVLRYSDISKNTDAMKVMRGVFSPDTGVFEAVSNIGDGPGWKVYHSKSTFDLDVFKRLSPAASKPPETLKPEKAKP